MYRYALVYVSVYWYVPICSDGYEKGSMGIDTYRWVCFDMRWNVDCDSINKCQYASICIDICQYLLIISSYYRCVFTCIRKYVHVTTCEPLCIYMLRSASMASDRFPIGIVGCRWSPLDINRYRLVLIGRYVIGLLSCRCASSGINRYRLVSIGR